MAAISTSPEGRPRKLKLAPVKGFRKREIARGAKHWLAPGAAVVTDGQGCWSALDEAACSHRAIRTGSGRQAARMASFKWVNTTLCNIKSAITGTYRKLGPDHVRLVGDGGPDRLVPDKIGGGAMRQEDGERRAEKEPPGDPADCPPGWRKRARMALQGTAEQGGRIWVVHRIPPGPESRAEPSRLGRSIFLVHFGTAAVVVFRFTCSSGHRRESLATRWCYSSRRSHIGLPSIPAAIVSLGLAVSLWCASAARTCRRLLANARSSLPVDRTNTER